MPSLLWVILSALLVCLSRLPLHLGVLVFVGWIPLWHYLQAPKARLWAASLLFSAIQMGIVFYWIADVTPGGLVGIGIVYWLYYWLAFYLVRLVNRGLPRWKELGFIAVMLSFEYLQSFGEMRFPWFNTSYSLADYTVLIQAADLGGVILLSGLIFVINLLLYRVLKKRYRNLLWVLLLLLLWAGYGVFQMRSLPLVKHEAHISVMQPSIPQDVKWDKAFYRMLLSRYDALCMQAERDSTRLLIFPEAAMPVYLMYDQGSLRELQSLSSKYHLDIFTGFPNYEQAPMNYPGGMYYYNAAALFSPNGSISDLYYKNILVPVGERMLWLKYFPFLWKLQFGQANWEFGKDLRYYHSGGYSFSPSICYELAFARHHQKMAIPVQQGRLTKTDYLVNITNDAWFGTSYGPWLHAMMAKFRAVENRIQIYRSANTGISLIVDPCGRILAKAGLFQTTNLSAPLYTCDRIPLYRHLAWYPMLLVALALVLAVIGFIKGKQGGSL